MKSAHLLGHNGQAVARATGAAEVGMARLIYSVIASLDGYVEDKEGQRDWAVPDEDVHAFANDLVRPVGTYLYGRRMYETMLFWETAGNGGDEPLVVREFAHLWRAADKVVYSRTLQMLSSERTRIERELDPAAVRELKQSADHDLAIGGAELAGQALEAGLVDECHLLLFPVIVGGGKRALPEGARARLELLAQRRFGSGVVYLRYGRRPTE
jgi:dihydrofolate reductase